jgi:hypothetical protein
MSTNGRTGRSWRINRLKILLRKADIPVIHRGFGVTGQTNALAYIEHIRWAIGLAAFSIINKLSPR